MAQHWLKPNWEPFLTLPELPIKHFSERKIKFLILDADKTLVHDRETEPQKEVSEWVLKAKKTLEMHILSNNPSRKRIDSIASKLSLPYTHLASKPRSSSLNKILKYKSIKINEIAIIGDRIFTDILLGNRMGIYTVLVKPLKSAQIKYNSFSTQEIEKYIAKLLGAEIR